MQWNWVSEDDFCFRPYLLLSGEKSSKGYSHVWSLGWEKGEPATSYKLLFPSIFSFLVLSFWNVWVSSVESDRRTTRMTLSVTAPVVSSLSSSLSLYVVLSLCRFHFVVLCFTLSVVPSVTPCVLSATLTASLFLQPCKENRIGGLTSGKVPLENTMRRQVFPQAPSPTITSFRRISVMVCLC